MKYFLAITTAAALVFAATSRVRTAGPTVVTVSLQRLASQSNAGKHAAQQLETIRQERLRELAAKQKALEDVVRQLAKTETAAADRERLTQDEKQRRTELQQLTQQAQSEFQTTQQRLQGEVRGQLVPILADIAKRAGVDAILNSDTIAWAAPGTDVTNEVLQRMNAAPQ